jgi:hypothetical protein
LKTFATRLKRKNCLGGNTKFDMVRELLVDRYTGDKVVLETYLKELFPEGGYEVIVSYQSTIANDTSK